MASLSLQSQGHLLLAAMACVTLGLLSWHRQPIGYPHLVPKSSADPRSMVVIPNQPKTLVQPCGPRQTHMSSGAASWGSPSPFYIAQYPGLYEDQTRHPLTPGLPESPAQGLIYLPTPPTTGVLDKDPGPKTLCFRLSPQSTQLPSSLWDLRLEEAEQQIPDLGPSSSHNSLGQEERALLASLFTLLSLTSLPPAWSMDEQHWYHLGPW